MRTDKIISKASDIMEVFNKLEEELSKLYESSMISRSENPKTEQEIIKKKAEFIISALQNKWVTISGTH